MDIEFPFDKIKKLHRSVCVKKKSTLVISLTCTFKNGHRSS